MNTQRPASNAAGRRRRSLRQPPPALLLALAGTLGIALLGAAVPGLRSGVGNRPSDVVPAALKPQAPASVSAHIGVEDLTPAAEALSRQVARRYHVARDSARDVVRAAFREGRRNGVDPLLILAVIAIESRFNPVAESEQGALGLMQIVPRFHLDKVGEAQPASILVPHANIAVGARILRDAIRRGGGEAPGLQLYNGTPDDDSRAYANRVLGERRRLEEAVPRSRDRA